MSSFFTVSQNKLEKNHGWDVGLTCSKCGFSGQPRYEGWSQGLETGIGPNVTILAKLACPRCGRRLTGEAAKELLTRFRDVEIPEKNKKNITQFITRLFLVPVLLAFVLFFGTQMDWWGWGFGTIWVLLVSAVSIPILLQVKNKRIAALTSACECGRPHYVYMGALDNNYCYRCFNCGRLLKLRE